MRNKGKFFISKLKMKSQRGSITLFVLVTLLFFVIILTLGYTAQMNKISSQKRQIEEIQKQYSTDGEMEEAYYEVENNTSE